MATTSAETTKTQQDAIIANAIKSAKQTFNTAAPTEDSESIETKAATDKATKQEKTTQSFNTATEQQNTESKQEKNKPEKENLTTAAQTAFNKKQQKKPETHANGFYIDPNGDTVHTNTPQGSMGDMITEFLEMILAMFLGGDDLEYWHMNQDFKNKNRDRYKDDPAHIAARAAGEKGTTTTSSHPLTDKVKSKASPADFKKVTGAVGELIKLINQFESKGNPNIVNDYRSRLPAFKGKGPFNGLTPGDTTLGGLTVPEFTEMTVKETREWQKKYNQEQKNYKDADFPKGIPIPNPKSQTEIERLNAVSQRAKGIYRSTALGSKQFLYGTLGFLTKEKYIKENEPFSPATQQRAGLALVIERVKRHTNGKDLTNPKTIEDLVEGMKAEWEGLKNADPEKIRNIMNSIVNDKEAMANLTAAAKPVTPS